MFDTGIGYGVSGIVSYGTGSGSQIVVTVRGFKNGLGAATHKITGPGSNFNDQWYASNVGGEGSFTGEAKSDLSPFPVTVHNLQGTLTLQYASTASTISFPVLIAGVSAERNEKTQNIWTIGGSWKKNGPYSLVWGGTQSYTQPTLLLQELFAGTVIGNDPNSLNQSATEVWFLPINGTANSDVETAVTTFQNNATAPIPGFLKLVVTSVERLDDAAGIMHVTWKPRDTADEFTMPATYTVADPQSLNSHAAVATINATTNTLAGFSLRSVKGNTIWANGTNGKTLYTSEFGLRNTAQDRTFPGTFVNLDTNGLFTTGSVVIVSNNSEPTFTLPSTTGGLFIGNATALKLVRATTVQQTGSLGSSNQYETHFNLSLRSTEDEVLFPLVVSTRSVLSPWADESPAIVNSTNQAGYTATQLMEQYQATTDSNNGGSLHGVTVRQRVDGKQIVVFHYKNVGILVKFHVRSGENELAVRSNPNNATVAQMYLIQNIPYGRTTNTNSSYRHILVFSHATMQSRVIRDFTVYYEAKGTTVPDAPPATVRGITVPAPGTINNASFLGLPAGTVKYVGVDGSTNLGLLTNGSMNFMLGYRFHYDSAGIWDFVPRQAYQRKYISQLPALLVDGQTSPAWIDVNAGTAPSAIIFPTIVRPQTSSFAALAPY